MSDTRRITTDFPDGLLKEAMETTGKGIPDTLIEGLELVCRGRALPKAMALKGRLALDLDLDVLRDR